MLFASPREVLVKWMAAVNAGDLPALLALYAPDAVLIPTFSNRLLRSPESIHEYFERLAGREELSLALHEKTVVAQNIHSGIHALSGIYCWRFLVDGELLSFEARFSYLLDLESRHPIIQHHSSQIPRVL